jgi:serine acetyltransferase
MWSELSRDLNLYSTLRFPDGAGRFRLASLWLSSPGLWVLALQRANHHLFSRRGRDGSIETFALRVLLAPTHLLALIFAKCDVSARTAISGGVYLSDGGYLVLGPHSIGRGTVIHHRVTIGVRAAGQGRPTIGDNVWIGPDCVIYGAVRLGDGSTVLPCTVLSMNVPDNAVAGGNPGRIVKRDFDNSDLRRSLACEVPERLASL